ncbi:MAG: hypothetical protein ACI4QZ_05610 [Eubacteriales bacterium]
MKKTIIAVLLFALFLSGCAEKGKNSNEKIPLEELPAEYSLEDAKKDGLVVIEDGSASSGKDIWYDFVRCVGRGESADVRLCMYYTLGSPDSYSRELYESLKDEYPKLFVFDLSFDGNEYHIRHFEEGKEISGSFKYLMKYEGEPRSSSAIYSHYVRYVLTDDESVVWEDIEDALVSSRLGAGVRHMSVYTELTYK